MDSPKVLCLAMVLLYAPGVASRAEDPVPTLIVATQNDDRPQTNEPTWKTEAGEVYRFVRFMTQSEYLGGSLPTHDKSYVVARVGDVYVVEPISYFTYPRDMAAAENKIKEEEKALARQDEENARAMAQANRDRTQQQILQELTRLRQIQELRFLNGR